MKTLASLALVSVAVVVAVGAGCGGSVRSESPTSSSDVSAGDASAPAPCGVGTWLFNENGDACGACVQGISDFVTLTVPAEMADGGGSVSDSEGNTWQYDPVACTLTTTGSCGIADTIDFRNRTASCAWTCGQACPACAGKCNYVPD
jgi:hypothetical protein